MDRSTEYAKKLQRMIQEKTVSKYCETDFARFRKFHGVLRELFPSVFSVCDFEDFDGSILLRFKGKDPAKKPIMFMSHHDVVEAEGQWSHPPFGGEIADGKIWGRGTVDTKGSLCCILQAAEELINEGFVPERDIYIESACTEECEGSGADKISQELLKRGIRFEYTLDEGGLVLYDPIGGAEGYFAMVAVAEKGCADLKFIARSLGGHASRPGKNTPLVRLGKFMAATEKSRAFKPYCSETVKEMFSRISQKTHGALKLIIGHPYRKGWLLARLLPKFSDTAASMMKTTIAFTMAGGSQAKNSLPQQAWVIGNMRYSHHQGQQDSFAAIKKIADRYGIEMQIDDPGFVSKASDFKSDSFAMIEKAFAKTYPDVTTAPYIAVTASDNRFMTRVSDNCYGVAPFKVSDQQLDSVHGLNENLDIAVLESAVDFYKYLMKEGKNCD